MGEDGMTLSAKLRDVDLTIECKLCGHLIVKKGKWFWTVASFKCQLCNSVQLLTYREKLALFAKHAHLA
jgi:hypothetical protein